MSATDSSTRFMRFMRFMRFKSCVCGGTVRRIGTGANELCRLPLEKGPFLELLERLPELLLGIHHDRSIPGHRLLERLAGHQKEAYPFVTRLHADLIAAVEEDKRAVVCLRWRRRVEPAD